MQIINRLITHLSTAYLGGLPNDQISTILLFLLSYPLGHLFTKLPKSDTNLRHIYSICISLFMLIVVQELYTGALHLFISASITYIMLLTLKGSKLTSAVFIYSMLHLSYSQYLRQMSESDNVNYDHTGPQMIMVIKMTSLAFCLYDGQKDIKTLSTYQRKHAIKTVPNFLEYLGYMFFFPSLLAGPAFEISTYRQMISMDHTKIKPETTKGYFRLLIALACGAFYFRFSGTYTYSYMLTESFKSHNHFYKIYYLIASGFVYRSMYYIAWKMSEGACMVTGLGFSGFNKEGKYTFHSISNVEIIKVEFATYHRQVMSCWNIGTNNWLRQYVYLRVMPESKTSSSTATLITFIVSAWWHGFYPGYYLAFITATFISNTSRILFRALHPFYEQPKFMGAGHKLFQIGYTVIGMFLTSLCLAFELVPFVVLKISTTFQIWSIFYYNVIIGIISVMLYFDVLGGKSTFRHLHKKLNLVNENKKQTGSIKSE
ncbi:hypothetical protein BB561_002022 [Smittium simulii]|uniref:Uncharacterized protein n=1 Tax=Smittium simulii TaxID=133385 RepID=A0A2T9YS01_9FUNG|nr:hypothetical protein BB561_002022 [Smittium simulii]